MFFEEVRRKGRKPIADMSQLTVPVRERRSFNYFTYAELEAEKFGELTCDTESFENYFLIAFRSCMSGKIIYFEKTDENPNIDVEGIRWIFYHFKIVTFNGNDYDLSIIKAVLLNIFSSKEINDISKDIIIGNMRSRDVEERYGAAPLGNIDHVDLIEVAPLQASLKAYGARKHAPRLQELPYNFNLALTAEQIDETRYYCFNDLEVTNILYDDLRPQIALREELGRKYDLDLRSHSDAQIAEAVIVSEIKRRNGRKVWRPKVADNTVIKYKVPDYIEFKTPYLQERLEQVRNAEFVLNARGEFELPEFIKKEKLFIGNSVYQMGVGGLHSTEKIIGHYAENGYILRDRDVESYYPRIILNQKLFPTHIGPVFLDIFNDLVVERIAAKHSGNMVIADSIKITINGTFGKLGSKWSAIYAPQLMLQVTMTGQLSLLMLIEMLECAEFEVVSANTDGIITKILETRYPEFVNICEMWEKITSFKTEETEYKAVFNRDVNNYIVLLPKLNKKGEICKVKGAYSEKGSAGNSVLSKNPEHLICQDAMVQLIAYGTPVEETIANCKDFRRFITVRNVKGGGHKDGRYLGKVVRWYYAQGEDGAIHYIASGNKVAGSDRAKPCMDMPEHFPNDINYDWYINKTVAMLTDVGYYRRPTKQRLI